MIDHPYFLIIAASLSLGLVAGFIMHRSDYCLVAMFRDYFLFGHTFMLRTLVLLVLASMILFEIARYFGLFAFYPFPLIGSPSLANIFGGFLFGISMVLAGGCVVGTLYKMGAGSLVSTLAFVGLIAGSTLYAEIHPWWRAFIQATTFFPNKVTIPQILGINSFWLIGPIVLGMPLFIYRWFRQGKLQRLATVEGYLQPWKAALALAMVGLLSYVVVGMPLGITTTYAKLGGYLENMLFPEHFAGLAYFQAQPLNYIPPFAHTAIQGGAGPRFDAISAVQIPSIVGIILGSAASAFLLREFRIYFRVPVRQYISAFAGGVLMGLASRLVPGCNVWHLLGGLPLLAASSLLFLVGMMPGAWLGSRILGKFVLRD